MKKNWGFIFLLVCVLISCESEPFEENLFNSENNQTIAKESNTDLKLNLEGNSDEIIQETGFELENLIEESFCEDTEFRTKVNYERNRIISDPYYWSPIGPWFDVLRSLGINYAFKDEDPQYFGNNGLYTDYVNKRIRDLEIFWDMYDEISVKGYHNEQLNDFDFLVRAFMVVRNYPESWALNAANAAIINNSLSEVMPESPLLTFSALASQNNKIIIIGDGLVKMVSGEDTDERVAWTTILSHEWAHHIQYKYKYSTFWVDKFGYTAERTRAVELEADFIATYYMTHKRGATYNMKRIEQALNNFFQVGDCRFTEYSHHGTPLQRKKASQLGFELAASDQFQGMILSPDEIHSAFINVFDDIVAITE